MSTATVPRPAELSAPAGWRTVDFISDLHLQASEPATFAAWRRYLAETPADALFILGDLFEVWVGDDAATPGSFEALGGDCLREASARCTLFFLHGNRDFLLGPAFAAQCRMRLLEDPTVLAFAGQRWLLSHGDALCLDDLDYQRFRAEVRSPNWQQDFLARPLAERQALARQMRARSEARKRSDATYADVDAALARQWLQAANATTLIHGHTHRPADHPLGEGLRRIVLSDWDAGAQPPRAQVLRLTPGADPQRLDLY
ncbi:UDP-2,3-diacylglucosamine diphosphatase [Ramlibacter sp. 2FC]|uniref:UDP-2,3-diacylglucosamine diphosphatase n=1 Tax=Ramlibacter sp. 2FC TaxID=2502188 RepID=UPI0010F60EC3|nr:UDP-2,3-diacylglucosamine diphosphatase [Ramlibacter sp. 2FC]